MSLQIKTSEDLIAVLKNGTLSRELWEEHLKAVAASTDCEKPASITLKISYDIKVQANGNLATMTAEVSSKLPKPVVSDSLFSHSKILSTTPEGQEDIKFETPTRDQSTSFAVPEAGNVSSINTKTGDNT